MTEPSNSLTAGKLRGLTTLADDSGVFRMIAVDQRPPIFRALARHENRSVDDVQYDEVANVKTLLTKVLAPESTAVLIDPVWTHPHALGHIPGRVALISTLEDYSFALVDGERRSSPIEAWTVAKIKRTGAAGVKVLAWDRPDASAATRAHQDAFVLAAGDACREHDIPFILELLVYPKPGEEEDTPEFARAKPDLVLDSVRHYADDRFGVDLLKLQFPLDLGYCREFAHGEFDGREREALYGLEDAERLLAELHGVTNVPWVLLSAGVGPKEFAKNLELAFAAGASGFLAGRAIWLDALDAYPDLSAVEMRLAQRSLPYLRRICELAGGARSWRKHPRYGGRVALEGRGPEWYRTYGAGASVEDEA